MSKFQESALHNDTLNKDPFELFDQWFKQAQASELNDPDAMALASVNSEGVPSVRIVLLKQWSKDGFIFFTNYNGRKSRELIATKNCSSPSGTRASASSLLASSRRWRGGTSVTFHVASSAASGFPAASAVVGAASR